jgi:uncharacterized protein
MIREKLETLSDDMLMEYAATLGLEIPEGLERAFVIESILDSIEDEQDERDELAAVGSEEKKYTYPYAELPSLESDEILLDTSYNETRITLMLRDPYWAYTYWEIRDSERKAMMVDPLFEELFLRVVESKRGEDSSPTENFDIPVSLTDDRWYINLPNQDCRYHIELISRVRGEAHVLARSGSVRTPRVMMASSETAAVDEGLVLLGLSGVSEMIESGIIHSKVASRSRSQARPR